MSLDYCLCSIHHWVRFSPVQHQSVLWLLKDQHTCVEQPDCFIGVQAKLGCINRSSLRSALEECNPAVAVVHKALADAAVGGHVVADLSQCVWQRTLLNAVPKSSEVQIGVYFNTEYVMGGVVNNVWHC